MYLERMEKNLSILAEIEMRSLSCISGRSEECTGVMLTMPPKAPYFPVGVIWTNQLGLAENSPIDENIAVQVYHTMKQVPGESANKNRVRIKDTVEVMVRLGLEGPS